MAKLRFQSEWRIWAALAIGLLLVVAYLYFVSRPPMEGGEYLWRVTRVVDEKTLNLKGSGAELQLKLIGVRVPGQEKEATREFLTKNLQDQWVRLKIIRDDSKGQKQGLVFLSGEDVIARMIRQGLAEIDRDEKEFDIRPYLELEQQAKKEKRGLWK
jgi:micrococcal nuclease